MTRDAVSKGCLRRVLVLAIVTVAIIASLLLWQLTRGRPPSESPQESASASDPDAPDTGREDIAVGQTGPSDIQAEEIDEFFEEILAHSSESSKYPSFSQTEHDLRKLIQEGEYERALTLLKVFKATALTDAYKTCLDDLALQAVYLQVSESIPSALLQEIREAASRLEDDAAWAEWLSGQIVFGQDIHRSAAAALLLIERSDDYAIEMLMAARVACTTAAIEAELTHEVNKLSKFLDGLMTENISYVEFLSNHLKARTDFGGGEALRHDVTTVAWLCRTKSPEAAQAFFSIASDRNGEPFKRYIALRGLGSMHNEVAVRQLAEFIADGITNGEDEKILAAAAEALGGTAQRAALEVARDLLPQTERDSLLQNRLMHAVMMTYRLHYGDFSAEEHMEMRSFYGPYRGALRVRHPRLKFQRPGME